MKFEEQFPALFSDMGKICDDFGRSYASLGEAPKDLIQEHCLDKAKVREAIQKVIDACYAELKAKGYTHEDSVPHPEMIQEELVKELGIE